jgi:hypothetical protein
MRGVEDARMLVAVPGDTPWPLVTIHWRQSDQTGGPDRIGDRRADVELLDGERAVIERTARRATLLARSPADDGRLVHPFLAAVGTIFAWWNGQDALHGGAFLTEGGAWALLGERGAGKSSMLAALHLAGHPVLADDVIVIAGGAALAGPRCVDLRPDAVHALGVADRVETVRGGERFRLVQPEVQPQAPLRGWIALSWSERVDARPLTPAERLEHLAAHSAFPPQQPGGLVGLAELPGWELTRPRTPASLEPAVDRLLDLCSA